MFTLLASLGKETVPWWRQQFILYFFSSLFLSRFLCEWKKAIRKLNMCELHTSIRLLPYAKWRICVFALNCKECENFRIQIIHLFESLGYILNVNKWNSWNGRKKEQWKMENNDRGAEVSGERIEIVSK